MDSVSIAASLVAARQSAAGQTAAMSMLRSGAKADQAIAGMLEQAVDSAKALTAAPPPGMGQRVDVTA